MKRSNQDQKHRKNNRLYPKKRMDTDRRQNKNRNENEHNEK
jgi:hypothetical protein